MSHRKGRSRVTNRPPVDRYGQSRKATTRRVRDLFDGLLARIGSPPHDIVTEARALRAAELLVVCEGLRTKALAGELADVNELTRLESTAARAERALFDGAEPVDPGQAALENLERFKAKLIANRGRQEGDDDHAEAEG